MKIHELLVIFSIQNCCKMKIHSIIKKNHKGRKYQNITLMTDINTIIFLSENIFFSYMSIFYSFDHFYTETSNGKKLKRATLSWNRWYRFCCCGFKHNIKLQQMSICFIVHWAMMLIAKKSSSSCPIRLRLCALFLKNIILIGFDITHIPEYPWTRN